MIINDLFNNKKFVAEAIGDLGSKRDRGKTIRKWRKSRGLDEQGGTEDPNSYNVVQYYEKTQEVKKLTNWLEKNAGLPKNSPLYFDDVDLVYGNKTIVPGALVDPTLTFNDLLTAVVQASKQGMGEATGDERFDTMMGQIQREPKYPDSQMPPTDVKDLYQWAVENNKLYHEIFAEWAMREGYKSVAPALQRAGDLDTEALDYWTPRVWKIYWGELNGIDSEMPPEWAKKRVPEELRDYLETVFEAYNRIVFDWPTEYRQIGQQGMAEAKKKKKSSRKFGGYFFPGYGYYGSGESGEGGGDGGGESANRSMAEDDDAVAAFLARGGQVQNLKPARPRKGERWQGSAHIGAAGGRGTKGQVSGLGANTGKSGKPVVTAEASPGDYDKKAQLSRAMAQTNRFFDRDDAAKVAAADRTIANRTKGLARADARRQPYTPPAQDAEKMQRDLTAKYPNIDELVAKAEQRRDPNYDYAEGNAYYDGREAEQNYQKLKQIQRVIQGLNESLDRSHLP